MKLNWGLAEPNDEPIYLQRRNILLNQGNSLWTQQLKMCVDVANLGFVGILKVVSSCKHVKENYENQKCDVRSCENIYRCKSRGWCCFKDVQKNFNIEREIMGKTKP